MSRVVPVWSQTDICMLESDICMLESSNDCLMSINYAQLYSQNTNGKGHAT